MYPQRPVVFVGSSSEGLAIAKNVQVLLDPTCEVVLWCQGVFGLGQGTLESLVAKIDDVDFAILVLTPDDMVESRDETRPAPRDNVLFELGLCIGGLGIKRTFIIHKRTGDLRIPSDLAGITMATFQLHASGNLRSSLGAPCTLAEDTIIRLGIREERLSKDERDSTLEFPYTQIINGAWKVTYGPPNNRHSETATIRPNGEYYVGERLRFYLKNLAFDRTQNAISYDKIRIIDGKKHHTEVLVVKGANLIEGHRKGNKDHLLRYERQV